MSKEKKVCIYMPCENKHNKPGAFCSGYCRKKAYQYGETAYKPTPKPQEPK